MPFLPLIVAVLLAPPAAVRDDDTFARQVLPILEARCFECHGPGLPRPKGGLVLDGRASLLRGGASGPALVPGDVDGSLLVQAIRRVDPLLEMPPREALPEDERLALEAWVASGAPWPGRDASPAEDAARHDGPQVADLEAGTPEFTHEQLLHFEQSVRPLLIEHCFACHGPEIERPKAGLRMGSRADLLAGGLSGPAVVPGQPWSSLLVRAVGYQDGDLAMPPDGALPRSQINTLVQWIADGAPYPGGSDAAPLHEATPDVATGRSAWAFSPVRKPAVPAGGGGHPIDAFIDARLASAGLPPNPPADPRVLARRTWLDLVGLPPTREDLDAFAADPSPAAHARLVDDLLARPEHGERWARHWLDVVRFAQTNGYERDTEKPYAWRYRDWVIDALNRDLPYDRFLALQLAGDELPDAGDEGRIASGFHRLGTWDYEPDDRRQAEFDELDDVVRTISEGMLGITLGCARCHDHKFDPLPQRDYYAMVAMLRGLARYEDPRFSLDSPTHAPLGLGQDARPAWEQAQAAHLAALQRSLEQTMAAHRNRLIEQRLAGLPPEVAAAWHTPVRQRTPAQRALLAAHAALRPSEAEVVGSIPAIERRAANELNQAIETARVSFAGDLEWALVARERGTDPPATQILGRGLASLPGDEVAPAVVSVLCPDDASAAVPIVTPASGLSSGRRSALAAWVASETNPLTARVMVNRVWQHHFGQGLVATPNDFGAMGEPPSHPELLDWLAAEFVASGWSLKHLHRLILSSAAWQRSSLHEGPGVEADPDNRLLWRQSLRRLDAEVIHDALVQVSGGLDPRRGGRGAFAEPSREALAGSSRPGEGWEPSPPADQERRAVYLYLKRSLLPPLLETFDFANPSLPVGRRVHTATASQALVLWNHPFVERQAARLAQSVALEVGEDVEDRVARVVERVLARAPRDDERSTLAAFLRTTTGARAAAPPEAAFAPRVPVRVDGGFLELLSGADVLAGPASGWAYLKGPWGNGYNSTLELDLDRGPAALANGPELADLEFQAEIRLGEGLDLAALLFRATADGDGFQGLELRLDPGERRADLRLHAPATGDDLPGPLVLAATAPDVALDLAPGAWISTRVALAGSRLRFWLGDDPEACLDVDDARLLGSGVVGLRAWGDALSLRRATLRADGVDHALPLDPTPPDLAALQALALALLNSNEFLYVE